MKKIIALGFAALAMAAVAPSVAGADDVRGPSCVDIIGDGSGGSYLASGLVTVRVALASPNCEQFDYSVVAVTSQGEVPLTLVGQNEAGTLVFFQGSVDPTNASVCIYGTTSVGDSHHVFDRAPDTGCIDVPREGSPSFGGFE